VDFLNRLLHGPSAENPGTLRSKFLFVSGRLEKSWGVPNPDVQFSYLLLNACEKILGFDRVWFESCSPLRVVAWGKSWGAVNPELPIFSTLLAIYGEILGSACVWGEFCVPLACGVLGEIRGRCQLRASEFFHAVGRLERARVCDEIIFSLHTAS